MILPTLSKHGTDKDTLMDQLKDLKFQIEACTRKLYQAYPHPRDYLDTKTHLEACNEHIEQYDKLTEVFNYVQARLEAIDLL